MKHRKLIRLDGFDYGKSGYYFVTVDIQNKLKLMWGENFIAQKGGHIGPPVHEINMNAPVHEINMNAPVHEINMNAPVHEINMNAPVHEINMNAPVHEINMNAPVHEINQIGKMIEYWWYEISNHFKNNRIDEFVVMPDHIHGIIQIENVGADRCVRPDGKNNPKLGTIVQWFKTMTTNEYIRNVKLNNWPQFHKRLWQRNYYERIIRNNYELERIRKYINENPEKLIRKMADIGAQCIAPNRADGNPPVQENNL